MKSRPKGTTMRTMTLLLGGMIGLVGGYTYAQTTRQMGALAVRDKAPTDKAIDLTDEDLIAVVKEMPGKNLATTRLLEGGYYSVNVRRLTGPETAHVHPTSLTIYVVREGSGTLVTGGTIVDAKGQPVTAGRAGDDLKGGVERSVKAGDIIVTPPGVPHFMRDVKEPLVFMNLIFEREK
jgi:mannose-6-phosphate isomerase-like protein (cupin superfamily)